MPGQTGKQLVNTDMTFIAQEIAKNNELSFHREHQVRNGE
jgi:hypothetical protein